jgi:ATP-dependent DNA ligase
MKYKIQFIKPMAPTLAKVPPGGPEWLHEVKFDGWRAQVHVEGYQPRSTAATAPI